jgi:O-antigen/teichoic acid export membrane protein
MGAGYWALLVQLAVSQLSGTALTWINCRWIPGRPKRGVGARPMLKFGGYLTGFSFVNYFARNADNILIGKVWGSSELGLYAKAYGLLLLPLQQVNGPISAVAIPALSRLQNDPEGFREFFRKVLSVITFVTFPLIAWMIVCRQEIVLLILGPQWEGAIRIFGILAISAFFQPIGNITGILYVTLGRTKRMFKWGLMSSSWLVLSFLVGLPYGAIGVALAYSIAMALMTLPLIMYAISGTFLRLKDYYDGIKYSLLSTALIASIGVLVQFSLANDVSSWLSLGVTSAAMLFAYVATSYKLNKELLLQSLQILLKKELRIL